MKTNTKSRCAISSSMLLLHIQNGDVNTKIVKIKLIITYLSQVIDHQQLIYSLYLVVFYEFKKKLAPSVILHSYPSRLHKLGIKVKKITVIGDVLNEISTEVKDFSSRFNYVITTGGIGPTHDDITFEAVAKAFEEPVFLHPDLVKLCQEFYKTSDPNSPGMKLARVPKSARLTFKGETESNVTCVYPNVSVRNVYMFPGIPQLLQKSFDVLSSTLFRSSERFYTKTIYFNVTEDKIAGALGSVVQEFPDVFIGSYPKMFVNTYKVKITIESTEENVTTEAYNKLLHIVPKGSVVEPV